MNLVHEPLFGITLGWFAIILVWVPLCFWILLVIGRRTRPGPFKWALLTSTAVLMGAIPLGDDAYIQWHFNRLCRDAGLHYERKIEVDGYYYDIGPIGEESFLRRGLQFVEYNDRVSRKMSRLERSNGKVTTTEIDQPSARYHYKYLYEHERIGYRLRTYQTAIVDTQTGKIVGRSASYTRGPGWLDGLWLGYFDNPGRQCPKVSGREYGDLLSAVLIPSSRN